MNKIVKCNFLVIVFILLLNLSFSSCKVGAVNVLDNKKTQKPNIIYILTDDLGYGDIGVFFQNERKKADNRSEPWLSTPNLDKMAQEGAMLNQHYAAAPVCAPSRASFFSGLSQGHANVRNNQFDKALADNHTIGNILQKAGYATALIGKWGLQGDKQWSNNNGAWTAKPNDRGFDYFYGYMRHLDGHEHYPVEGIYGGSKEVWENNTEVSQGLDKSYTGDLWTAVAKKWIIQKVKNDSKPFFMVLAYDTPHAVLELPTQAYPKGGGLRGGVQWIGKKGQMINTATGNPDTYVHPDYVNATYDHDKNNATSEVPWPDTYKRQATIIRRIDDAVGDLMQLLKDLNIDNTTLVVFSSDNGPSDESYLPKHFVPNRPNFFDSFGPFDGIKRDVLEGGVRVPAIVRWPQKIAQNTIVEQPNIAYDWLPTFANVAGIAAPANADGVSLLPSLTGQGIQKESSVYVEYYNKGTTPTYDEFDSNNRGRLRGEMQLIRKGKYLGLRYNIKNPNEDFEIYDVIKDTHQHTNLAKTESMAEVQKWMKDRVLQVRIADTSSVRPYDKVVIPSVKYNHNSKNGLHWKAFSGVFPWLPNLEDRNPEISGTVSAIEALDFKKYHQKLFLLDAYIDVPKDGEYIFSFSAKEKALVRVHNITLIDADYGYQSGTVKTQKLWLQKGLHPLKILLENKAHFAFPFTLEWKGLDTIGTDLIPIKYYYE